MNRVKLKELTLENTSEVLSTKRRTKCIVLEIVDGSAITIGWKFGGVPVKMTCTCSGYDGVEKGYDAGFAHSGDSTVVEVNAKCKAHLCELLLGKVIYVRAISNDLSWFGWNCLSIVVYLDKPAFEVNETLRELRKQ
jgi:hypothetical protein